MDDHEAQRIAAAMHAARPDWPASSLLTLIRKKLIDKPRRDVLVALAWVASEPASATPARVLEQGPWWKAAGVEGTATGKRDWPDDSARCSVCSLHHDRCRQLWADDHEFLPSNVKPETDVARAVQGLRDIKRTEPPAVREKPKPSTAGTARVAPIRAALAQQEADA